MVIYYVLQFRNASSRPHRKLDGHVPIRLVVAHSPPLPSAVVLCMSAPLPIAHAVVSALIAIGSVYTTNFTLMSWPSFSANATPAFLLRSITDDLCRLPHNSCTSANQMHTGWRERETHHTVETSLTVVPPWLARYEA